VGGTATTSGFGDTVLAALGTDALVRQA